MKLLICGDSFAADWTVKYPDGAGWPNYLAKKYDLTNCAQAGCSEYKILKQLQQQDLSQYTHVVISHTSATRIPVDTHPVHYNDILHKNSDLIYSDIQYHAQHNPNLTGIIEYFERYFDLDYAQYCYNHIVKDIDVLLSAHNDLKILHTSVLVESLDGLITTGKFISYHNMLSSHQGLHNHFNNNANQLVFADIEKFINE